MGHSRKKGFDLSANLSAEMFALIRAVDLILRGSRKRIHGTAFADGAELGIVFQC